MNETIIHLIRLLLVAIPFFFCFTLSRRVFVFVYLFVERLINFIQRSKQTKIKFSHHIHILFILSHRTRLTEKKKSNHWIHIYYPRMEVNIYYWYFTIDKLMSACKQKKTIRTEHSFSSMANTSID